MCSNSENTQKMIQNWLLQFLSTEKKKSPHLKYYSLPIVPSLLLAKYMYTHKHKQTESHHDENRALSPAAYQTNKPAHKKCSLSRWKRRCKAVGRMGRRRFGIFTRLRSRFLRQSRENNGGFAAKTFTRAKTIPPAKKAIKNAAEIQFGTKFLFGLLIELITRCDFSSRGVLG